MSQIEIPEGKYNYNDIIEWPNTGALIINDEPNFKARDYNLVLVNTKGEVQWQETIYPKKAKPVKIVSGQSNYIYFFDQLEIENARMEYHQINKSGSVKSTNINFLSDLRKFGFTTPDEFEVVNISNTPKALVFQLRFENKSEKQYENILFFLTHHNHRTYPVKLEPTSFEHIKNELESTPYIAGNDDELIYFAKYQKLGARHTFSITGFSAKGDEQKSTTIAIPKLNSLPSSTKSFIFEAAHYQEKKDYYPSNFGVVLFSSNDFYYVENDSEDLNLKIWKSDADGKLKTVKSTTSATEEKRRINSEITLFKNVDGNWIIRSKIEDDEKNLILSEDIVALPVLNIADKRLRDNSSLFKYNQETAKFVLPTSEGKYFFDYNQLGNKENLQFTKD